MIMIISTRLSMQRRGFWQTKYDISYHIARINSRDYHNIRDNFFYLLFLQYSTSYLSDLNTKTVRINITDSYCYLQIISNCILQYIQCHSPVVAVVQKAMRQLIRHDKKTKYEKYFFGGCLPLSRFLAKTVREKKKLP